MNEEKCFKCPLVGRDMWDSECYDVLMVHYGFINPKILDFVYDESLADKHCNTCPFNQLKQDISDINNQITA